MSTSPTAREPTDEVLAQSAQNGCAQSFEALMRRYQAPLLYFLRMRASSDAEDLLQETFLRAFRGLSGYRRGRPVRPWLFAIARHVGVDAGRRQTALTCSDTVDQVPSGELPPQERMAREEKTARLWSLARALLSETEWTALWLHYAEDMPTGEVGAVLGRSRSAIKTMLCRARKRLARHLSHEDDELALPILGGKR